MVAYKSCFLTFLLANLGHLAAASPISPQAASNTTASIDSVSAAAINLSCRTGRTDTVTFRLSQLTSNMRYFPDNTHASGYPKRFFNDEGFRWEFSRAACEAGTTLEMPVFTDGHLYDWDRAPRPSPGLFRLVYVSDGTNNALCGLIVHRGDAGDFELCNQI
ncbi:Ribonuclease/ribotoxin [Apodospora peruviana]|uniref:Ribonuclease/ribotoxin n=1 Tax=Apodospora peruviana TaxID=516989 RepID=A0AAE0HUE6_9PEZI|nr:Ribonuclease/ribotoxin [Apodospora peruviana]